MNEIQTLLQRLRNIAGKEAIDLARWEYEKAKAEGRVLLPPPQEVLSEGEYELGRVVWDTDWIASFGLREEELPQHVGIFGRTGAGKTNCAYLFLRQLIEKEKPFLIFDWKQSYRNLCNQEVKLFTPGLSQLPFSFNPLNLENIPAHLRETYLRHLLSVLLNVYFRDLKLLTVEGVEYLLLRGMDFLRKQKGSFTFQDLYYWILNYKGAFREKDWKSSVLNVLYKLTTGPLGQVLNQEESIKVEDIIKGQSVIELHWLGSPKDKSFVMQSLLLQLYYHFSQMSLLCFRRNWNFPLFSLVI